MLTGSCLFNPLFVCFDDSISSVTVVIGFDAADVMVTSLLDNKAIKMLMLVCGL